MSAGQLRIRGCFHEPPHAGFKECPENDAWMFPGDNTPVPDSSYVGNHILCPECFVKDPAREEKCCAHGTATGTMCVGCGKTRADGDPYWSCLGTIVAPQPPLERGDPRLPSLAYNFEDHEEWRARLHEYIRLRGFRVWSDPAELSMVVHAVLAQHPEKVAAYRAGKTKLLGFFVAEIMKATRDGASMPVAEPILLEALNP